MTIPQPEGTPANAAGRIPGPRARVSGRLFVIHLYTIDNKLVANRRKAKN